MRPRKHLTINQQYFPLCGFKQDVLKCKWPMSLECFRASSAGCNKEYGRVTIRHKSGCPLATSHTDDCFIVNSAVTVPGDECHSTPGTFKGGERNPSVMSDHLKQFISAWSAC
ncbi:hypothetical protein ILYODFUR_012198 [Ilyodon furcidens]|uniref:Uncharacterized protein n=1 Tax=Ilyodon furcidens TaxID=33524 RepID=A0ABV0T7E6_9TELE